MLRIRHILLPYDFSDRCDATAPCAADLARRFDARLTMLTVVPPVWHNSPEPKLAVAWFDSQRLQAILNEALREDFDGLKVERVCQQGDPAATILDYAHSKRADVIMMPTHGYGPFRSLLLGSVTAKVLHDARCPVWTAAHSEELPEEAEDPNSVLCAVDGSPKSVALIRWAADWAEATDADLRLVHAVHMVTDMPRLKSEQALQEQARQDAKAAVEKHLQESGVEAPLSVINGSVGEVVHDEAARMRAGIVVIGRGVLHGTLGRLRTHAYSIIRQSPCPVLSV